MKIKKSYILMPLLAVALTSCGNRNIKHKPEEYILSCPNYYNEKKGFNIIQLSDTHIGNMCNRSLQYKFLQHAIDGSNKEIAKRTGIENQKADLIVVTGDLFTFGTREVAKEYFAFLDNQKIPWTVCFGNHDEQAYYSIDWLTGYLNDLNDSKDSYCLFKDHQDDDVFGNSNFVIQVKDEKDKKTVVENLYVFDSNRYNFEYNGYDRIHQDQIDWYDSVVKYTKDNNSGIVPQGLAFFHIPLPEYNDAINLEKKTCNDGYEFKKDLDGKELNFVREHAASPKKDYDLHLYNHFKESNVRGMFVGHDHNNAYCVKNKTDNIYMSFGVKATDTVECSDESLGAQVIMLKKDFGKETFKQDNFDIIQYHHTYEDIKEGK